MIRPLGTGLYREVGPPRYGAQDLGVSPGGPQDRFAWESARILLGEHVGTRTWELVSPPAFVVEEDLIGICTGGRFHTISCEGRSVEHATVFQANAGDHITWGIRTKGFRTVLAVCPMTAEAQKIVGRQRGEFSQIARWTGEQGALRVVPGPEAPMCRSLPDLLESGWMTALDSSDVGLRLHGGDLTGMSGSSASMVSGPVVDGTLQATPDGLILLLRSRPTVGGYPRLGTVIDADVDIAAQLPPRRRVRFQPISLQQAVEIRRQQQADLDQLRKNIAN